MTEIQLKNVTDYVIKHLSLEDIDDLIWDYMSTKNKNPFEVLGVKSKYTYGENLELDDDLNLACRVEEDKAVVKIRKLVLAALKANEK